METVKEYFLASATTIVEIQDKINNALKNGFTIYGHIRSEYMPSIGIMFYQAMIK